MILGLKISRNKSLKIPYFPQETDHTCGAASLRMALTACDYSLSEKEITAMFLELSKGGIRHDHFPSESAQNAHFPSIAENFKLNYVVSRNSSISSLKSALNSGYAVIVGYYYEPEDVGHYAVVKKITGTHIELLDPEAGPDTRYRIEQFLNVWHNDPRDDNEKRWFFGVKKTS